MGIGVSIFLIAAGAIMAFAVEAEAEGFDINTVGVILMVVGALGLLTSLVIWGPRRRATVVDEEPVGRTRRVYREDVV